VCAILLCRFHGTPDRSQLIAECASVEQPYFVDFAATPIVSIDPTEGFNVLDQRSGVLVFLRFNQHSPVVP